MRDSRVADRMIERDIGREISSRKSKGAHDFSEPLLNNFCEDKIKASYFFTSSFFSAAAFFSSAFFLDAAFFCLVFFLDASFF